MAKAASSPVPEGFHTLNVHLVVKNAQEAIEFYKKAFGAEVGFVMPGPGGQVMHAELTIGDCMLMLCDEMPQMQYWVSPTQLKGTTVGIALYVPDADAAFDRALAAGATVTMPLMDAFWGDRYGKVMDPFGHQWEIASHQRDLTPEEIQQGAEAFFANMAKGSCA